MSNTTKTLVGGGGAALVAAVILLSSGTPSTPPFAITQIVRVDRTVSISFNTQTNYFYSLQSCTNLSAPVWVPVYGETRGSGGVQTLDEISDAPRKFYRVWRMNGPTLPPAYPPMPLSVTNTGEIL
jgi:hypothetical protein